MDMQRILIDSLQGTPADTPARRNELKQGLQDIQRRLNMALRAQAVNRASTATTPRSGPSRTSSYGNATASDSSRKRTFSMHNGDGSSSQHASASKSRRTTPSPNDSDLEDASEIIDLSEVTGSGRDFLNRQKAEAERLRRRREQEERDAAFARSLQADVPAEASSSQRPRNSQGDGPSAFDRIRQPVFSQSSPSSQETSGPSFPSPVRALPTHPRTNPLHLPPNHTHAPPSSHQVKPSRMPGSFDSDDEGFLPYSRPQPSSRTVVDLTDSDNEADISGGYRAAAASAREAALRRQQQPNPGFSHYAGVNSGFGNATYGPSPFAPAMTVYGSGPHLNNASNTIAYPSPYGAYGARPGSLVGGSANPLDLSRPTMPYLPSALGRPQDYSRGGSTLANIIERTANIDYSSGLDIYGNPLDDRIRDYIHDVVDDPRKNEEEIRELLANIRPDMDIPQEDREDDPVGLRYPLYPHQRIALKWMAGQEEDSKKAGGILADDMGLGKTISTLALIVSRQAQPAPGQRTIKAKTNLIVGPVGLIRQWEREIAKKLKSTHRLSVFLAHGRKCVYDDLRTFDVVLTSYGTLGSEMSKRDKYVKEQARTGRMVDNATLNKLCPMLGPNSTWYRVILDEAQCIKNSKTWAAKAACELKAQYRWCLSGTPMMNSVDELSSLIQFLRIKPYDDPKKFRVAFGSLSAKRNSSGASRNSAMTRLQATLKAIMLRRTKKSQLNGKPIIQLTEKHEETVHVVFNDDEEKFYRDLEQNSQVQFSKYLKNGTVGKHYTNILALLTRLRQACCHPLLHMLDFSQGGNAEISEADMERLAESLTPDVIKRIRETEEFECPICMDAVQNPSIFVPCGHDTCSECLVCLANGSNEQGIQAGNENAKATCPECRGPVDFQKVITLDIFKQVHMPETVKPEPSTAGGGIDKDVDGSDDDSGSETNTDDDSDGSSTASDDDETDEDADEVDAKGNLRGFIVSDDVDEDFLAKSSDTDGSETKPDIEAVAVSVARNERKKRKASKGSKKKAHRKRKHNSKDKGKGKEKEDPVQPHMLRSLRKEASKNREAHRRYMRYLKEIWEPSAKVSKCIELIADIQKSDEKTIIFSQWTLLLDLLETPLKHELGIGYRRYDGSMSAKQRDAAAGEFMERSDVKVILVSLKAGNAGLNLTAASQVIIMDPFWNPYIEMQAVDRAHRIGQQRDVKVHRILVQETIEDRIVDLQAKKRDLVDSALSEEAAKNIGRLSTKDLSFLFGITSRNN
ncbi:SNF2 family N-terminal domain-containing protein [Microdochium trichocladiopsis]|uniref:SNF2 family N-terminal domain-containing protein n=1 Tax=Microdochium trichocladiopsis TaxID=1682393 RepID=A0A9P8YDY1_9PEZI|nr:SNF2 family N-terminal domain-containing protein [Microdochium trichocladiopsis]KAH7037102.1 SNF2 family N-terminal domain-containing protein [Microdochium trichocladiopsis]